MGIVVHSTSLLHEGRVFRMVRERVTLETGTEAVLDYIVHPGAAAIVPLASEDDVLLLRQYRHAAGGALWEIPAGTRDAGEEALACAARELAEETGFSAAAWRRLGVITPVPSYSDERIELFLASDLRPAHQRLDADEVLEVHRVPFAEALAMIDRGEIVDAKTICGLLLAERHLRRAPLPPA